MIEMTRRPRASRLTGRGIRLFLAATLAAVLLCSCQEPPSGRYVNDEYDFSFMPPKGWRFTAEKTNECLVSAEAAKDASCRIYVCVTPRIENLITMRDNFLNCEQIKTFVQNKLKGSYVECEPAHTWRVRAYQAKYLRQIRRGEGVTWQFVDQKYLIRGAHMFTVTAYALGDTPESARAVYEHNIHYLSLAMESVYFR
jgi:hypothetical protein